MTRPTILVANRGEIAVRVIRACREMGLRAAAVYSPSDRNAPHVWQADEAVALPGDPPEHSYLHLDALLEAARRVGATAIHPGYGFLAESAAFARACQHAGVRFVGPPPQVLELCGDKAAARMAMAGSGVPVLPGTGPVDDRDAPTLAERLGYPLLVKAAAGGGGKGIHLVREPGQLAATLRLARGEARTAFGDDRVYLEKWVEGARHVEVQVLADASGVVVVFPERDCSVQRRHQKLIEESPAPSLSEPLRARLRQAAAAAARAVGYVNAGTVEFLVGADEIYFLEVNARVQVEHPVTEMVTGVDLVAEQLRVALEGRAGVRSDVSARGWAIECRVGAEDPHEGFLPAAGRIDGVWLPGGPGIRIDAAVYAGMEVSHHYDPLLAKIIAWGADRDEALRRLRRAVDEAVIAGVPTTLPFHRWALREPAFASGHHDTGFVARWEARPSSPGAERVAVLAAVAAAAFPRGPAPLRGAAARWIQAARQEGLRPPPP
ncbi:MAG: biotin carboxylase N-terminal domain-containing protein [Armatimonadota bacterium]|nr:biotin carboxylase N-terminal domain-containing protein [Armatimonadota bacterium]